MVKKYKATEGAPFSQKKAQKYGEELNAIAEKNEGKIKPQDVIERAKVKSSALHDYFDWNNDTAAEKHRLWQARNLINHITVVIKHEHSNK